MFSQLTVLIIPLALAFAAVIAVTYLSNSLPLNGICRQCGENLPRRGIVRCPWCRRLCFVLRFR